MQKVLGFLKVFSLVFLASSSQSILAQASNDVIAQFERANHYLQQSNHTEKNARKLILKANKTRKLIAQLRADSRKEVDPAKKNELLSKANDFAKMLQKQQEQGAQSRIEALKFLGDSHREMQRAFVGRWQKWVRSEAPLTMDKETINFIAHNAQIRSVHPTMLNKMGSAQEVSQRLDEAGESNPVATAMTLQIPALVSQSAPPDLNIEAFRLSNNQNYFAHIEVDGLAEQELTNVSQVPLNQMHQWRLLVSDTFGNPVENAAIEIVGHMPGHVHGLPTQPRITVELEPGVYRVEGLKFQMQGWWVIQFNISGAEISEKFSDGLDADSGADASFGSNPKSDRIAPDSIVFNLIL